MDHNGVVYLIDLDCIDRDMELLLMSYLKKKNSWEPRYFRRDMERKRYLVSHTIPELVGSLKGYWKMGATVKKGPYGKPYIQGANMFYNISHSAKYIVFSYAQDPIGIDIEKISAYDNEVMKSCYTEDEILYVCQDENKQDVRFTEVWTRKEAYLKYIGTGLTDNMSQICVLNNKLNFNGADFIFIWTRRFQDYLLSVCGKINSLSIKIVDRTMLKKLNQIL